MSNLTRDTIYYTSFILNPWELSYNIINSPNFDFKEEYVNNKEALFKRLMNQFKKHYQNKITAYPQKNFWFQSTFNEEVNYLRGQLIEEAQIFKLKNINCTTFFNSSRIRRCSNLVPYSNFSLAAKYKRNFSIDFKVSKEELILIINTFCDGLLYISEELFNVEPELDKLAELGWPTEKEALVSFLSQEEYDIAESFSWSNTPQGLESWATAFFKGELRTKAIRLANSLWPGIYPEPKEYKKRELTFTTPAW